MTLRTLATFACAFAAITCASAQSPRTVAFRAALTKPNGVNSPAGNYSITFRIYDSLSSTTALWTETQTLAVSAGTFQAVLGSNTPIPAAVAFSDKTYYVGVSVGNDAEQAPRYLLAGVPYALALPGMRTEATVYVDDPHELGTPGTVATPNIIGGYYGNTIAPGVSGATISGGGMETWINKIMGDWGTIGGGARNQIGDGVGTPADRFFATVGGGVQNTAGQAYSTVSGGHVNSAMGAAASIAGGYLNTAYGYGAFIGSGYWNYADGESSTIAGGNCNKAYAAYSTIGGGGTVEENPTGIGNVVTDKFGTVSGGGYNQAGNGVTDFGDVPYATVGGGFTNFATGAYSTIPGGLNNEASGSSSFAAGNRAKAEHDGSFVWADGLASDFKSTAPNQFNARATGGVWFVTGVNAYTFAPTAGVSIAPGDNAWAVLSDRNSKTDFASVDVRQALHNVVGMPIKTWRYKTQSSVRHIGPMAQDFAAAFAVGTDDRHISTVDADGVALAAIQGLYGVVQEKDAAIETLTRRNNDLDARVRALEDAVAKLTKAQTKVR